ncbi:MAG: site-specific integrase, partial [Deltaproteobacteria bacterium]|nr:site-specific integrase [Deltaproteobacteria bacterium]
MGFADTTRRPPKTLTTVEQAALLKTTGEHRTGFRDHVLLAVALGSGLRVAEIVALDVGDVSPDGKRVRRRVTLRVFKRSLRDGGAQEVFLPD